MIEGVPGGQFGDLLSKEGLKGNHGDLATHKRDTGPFQSDLWS